MNDKSSMNQAPPPMMSQVMSQPMMMAPSSQAMAAQQQQSQLMMMSNQPQPLMMNRGYNNNNNKAAWPQPPQFAAQKPPPPSRNNNNNWKGKKGNDKRRMEKSVPNLPLNGSGQSSGGGYNVPKMPLSGGQSSSYIPPSLNELQSQNRMKARKFYPKKKFNNRFAPYAPRNTTSFIIRAKKSGGIASLVSPCPVTPAVLPTPIFSPSREVLGDTAKEEWGVDGYGSMKGLIRLRSPGNDEDEEEGGGGSSESDVEEHVEVERRLDHDLSRFEMIYPNYSGVDYNNVLENRVDDQDTHIAQLEEENLTLKERLFLMERELGDLRRRMLFIERRHNVMEANEEVVENVSENDSDGGSDAPNMSNVEVVDYVSRNAAGVGVVSMEECAQDEMNLKGNEAKDEVRNGAGDVFAMNKVSEVVGCEVETRNEDEFMQGQVNADKFEDVGTSCTENNNSEAVKNEVETKNEREMMQGPINTDKDQEMGIGITEKSIGVGD